MAKKTWRDSVKQNGKHEWTGQAPLPKLAKLKIDAKYSEWGDDDDDDDDEPRTSVDLEGENNNAEGVAPEQAAAVDFLMNNEKAVLDKMLDALAAEARELRAGGGWEEWDGEGTIDDVMPKDYDSEAFADARHHQPGRGQAGVARRRRVRRDLRRVRVGPGSRLLRGVPSRSFDPARAAGNGVVGSGVSDARTGSRTTSGTSVRMN